MVPILILLCALTPSIPGERMRALGYGTLAESRLAFACYAAVFLLSRLYLPVLLVFAGADVVSAYEFLRETVLREKGLPLVLALVSTGNTCWVWNLHV